MQGNSPWDLTFGSNNSTACFSKTQCIPVPRAYFHQNQASNCKKDSRKVRKIKAKFSGTF